MRKKLLKYIINETQKREIFSTVIEPTIGECYYLWKNNIATVKNRSKIVYPITNKVSLIDTIKFCKENQYYIASFFLFSRIGYFLMI